MLFAAIEAEEMAMRELAQQLQFAQDDLTRQERAFEEQRLTLRSESHRLKGDLESFESALSAEQGRSAKLERELQQVRAQLDSEGVARRILSAESSPFRSSKIRRATPSLSN